MPAEIDKFEGKDLEGTLNQLIAHFGSDVVQKAVLAKTKPRRGRKLHKDDFRLRQYYVRDAMCYLQGEVPEKALSNYAIANEFASNYVGQSFISTVRRVQRKLASDRRPSYLQAALYILSTENFPIGWVLRTSTDLYREELNEPCLQLVKHSMGLLLAYKERFGELPDPNATVDEVCEATSSATALCKSLKGT